MADVILMPRLSDTMTEGVIAEWHKKVGDIVKKGDLLAEVETDKATMELESYKDGTLLHIGIDKGGKLQVNDLLAIIGAPGEDVSALIKQNSGKQSAIGSKQSAVGSRQSSASIVTPSVAEGQQSAVGSKQSAVSSQQPGVSSEQPATSIVTPSVAEGQQSAAKIVIPSVAEGQQSATSIVTPSVPEGQQSAAKIVTPSVAEGQQPATSLVTPSVAEGDISKMEEVVLMPRLSDTMEEGVIATWHKNIGDTVKKGDVLAEIETDKATMELESYKNGKLLYIGAQKGEKIPVNALLCIIGEEGKVDVNAIVAAVGRNQSAVGSRQSATSNQQPATSIVTPSVAEGKQSAVGSPQSVTSIVTPSVVEGPSVAEGQQTSTQENGRPKASPLAKKLAAEKGIDIREIPGSGDGGRIIKADIDNYQPKQKQADKKPDEIPGAPKFSSLAEGSMVGEEGYTDISNSQIRNIIAKRLAESKFGAPHFYLTMEINMDNAISARAQLNEVSPVKISFNDLVVKAAALALRQHPAVNASWMGASIRRYHHIHIGIAVAIEDGLIVPVVRFADQKSLPQIAAESKELSGKARNKKLQPNEFSGNTFTISNLGMMDIDEFTAIINPPDSCIMAVGRIKEVVVRKADGFGTSNIMKITLSCDHRSVDGATGAAFLQTFKKYMENPVMMLL